MLSYRASVIYLYAYKKKRTKTKTKQTNERKALSYADLILGT